MVHKDKIEQTKPRLKGAKGEIFFDSIDYSILSSTQSEFKSAKDISDELQIAIKNLHPHIMKLVDIGLIDGVLDKTTNQYVFTSYFKLTGKDNNWGFTQCNLSVFDFLNLINNYIQRLKFSGIMEKLKTSDISPEIKKDKTNQS
jgi:predicted transcriptional regulator